MSELRTITLGGFLGKRYGRRHRLAVASPAEAVRALCALFRGFQRDVVEAGDRGLEFVVLAGNRDLGVEDLAYRHGNADIRIVPVLRGAKAGLFQTIIGAVLVVVGLVTGNWYLVQIGASLALSGISQMLSPHPKSKNGDKPNNIPNYSFNGAVNTQAQGNPVPVLYGRLKVGSAVISAGIGVTDGVYVPTTGASGGTGAAGGMGGGGGGGGALGT